MALMSLDPTGKGRKRWTMRWKAPLNAFQIAFEGRLTPSNNWPLNNQDQPFKLTHPASRKTPWDYASSTRGRRSTQPSPRVGSTPASKMPSSNTALASESTSK